jgi:SAM-dependent methyltransferase
MDVLEHIENDILVLEKFYDALKENGLLILHLPLNYELCERILPGYKNFDTHDHVRPEYTAEEITEKLIRVGFKIKELDYTYAKYGEIAFELNYLLWQVPSIRLFFAFITHPIVMRFAYKEIQYVSKKGNAMVILAQKPNDKKG